jgi:hypothetical protein
MPPPVEEILKIERKLTAKEVEEKFLWHVQRVITEAREENKIGVVKNGEKKATFTNNTKEVGLVKDYVISPHQFLDEGINNTFIFSNSLFLDEEKKDKSWGLDFDDTHSR